VAFERLFRTYRFVEPSEADEMLRVYFEALADYETRDIEAGIRDMLSGRVDGFNPSFLPPAPLVAKAVRTAMYKRLESEARDRKALPPPVEEWAEPTPEQKARVKALMAQVRRNYGSERSDKEREEATRAMLRRSNEHFDAQRLSVSTFNSADDDFHDMGGERVA
jgi:hypothetical protein